MQEKVPLQSGHGNKHAATATQASGHKRSNGSGISSGQGKSLGRSNGLSRSQGVGQGGRGGGQSRPQSDSIGAGSSSAHQSLNATGRLAFDIADVHACQCMKQSALSVICACVLLTIVAL